MAAPPAFAERGRPRRPRAPAEEVWPADDAPHAYAVGAGPPAPRLARARSHRSQSADPRAHRVASHHARPAALTRRQSAVFAPARGERAPRRAEARRSITEVEKVDVFAEGGEPAENSCYSIAATVVEERRLTPKHTPRPDQVVQGYCRMAWFAGLRCTRFLRLVRGQLLCFDSAIRKCLWAVAVDGARVRMQPTHNKIVLSKLQCGHLIEFFLYDQQSCRHWGAALLRAASTRTAFDREPNY